MTDTRDQNHPTPVTSEGNPGFARPWVVEDESDPAIQAPTELSSTDSEFRAITALPATPPPEEHWDVKPDPEEKTKASGRSWMKLGAIASLPLAAAATLFAIRGDSDQQPTVPIAPAGTEAPLDPGSSAPEDSVATTAPAPVETTAASSTTVAVGEEGADAESSFHLPSTDAPEKLNPGHEPVPMVVEGLDPNNPDDLKELSERLTYLYLQNFSAITHRADDPGVLEGGLDALFGPEESALKERIRQWAQTSEVVGAVVNKVRWQEKYALPEFVMEYGAVIHGYSYSGGRLLLSATLKYDYLGSGNGGITFRDGSPGGSTYSLKDVELGFEDGGDGRWPLAHFASDRSPID